MNKKPSAHFALVLPGAVARGAYEAGVIEVLAKREMKIDRIVATSSGALNGLAYAVGIHHGCEVEMAKKLVDSWVENGGWRDSLNINLWSALGGRGLSKRDGLLKMMHGMIGSANGKGGREVELHIIVTPLNGVRGWIAGKPATTYEHVVKFTGADFQSRQSLENVFNVVTAACAFPGLFEPVEIPGLGACVDGGAVNNAPIRYALEASGVNRVIMPVPFPALMKPGDWKRGFGLLNHLIEILINERLFRDLQGAQKVNAKADKLKTLVDRGVLSPEQCQAVKEALSIRNVEVTEVRPSEGIKSGSFSGFFHKKDRLNLIEQGRVATHKMLDKIPEQNPEGAQTT